MESPITPPFAVSNASYVAEPAMHFFSSALLLGSYALQSVLGRPKVESHRATLQRSVDGFIEIQTPIALERLLCNIGADGCTASGAAPGVAIASPDRVEPSCMSFLTSGHPEADAA